MKPTALDAALLEACAARKMMLSANPSVLTLEELTLEDARYRFATSSANVQMAAAAKDGRLVFFLMALLSRRVERNADMPLMAIRTRLHRLRGNLRKNGSPS